MFHALNCVCRQGAQNFTCCCRKWHSNCNNWAKETDCEDVAMAWKPGVSWDDWDTLWEGVPILKGWSLQCNGKSFVLWSELSTDGTKWGWMARNMNSVHHIDLSSHRVSWSNHGSSCIWPAGSRCQETFMSQWLHWWLSSLYFVVSHKGIARARPFLPQFEVRYHF